MVSPHRTSTASPSYFTGPPLLPPLSSMFRRALGMDFHRVIELSGDPRFHAFGHIGFTNVFGWADPERDVAAALLRSGKPTIYPQILDLYDVLRQIGLACPRIRDGSRIGSDDRRSSASAA